MDCLAQGDVMVVFLQAISEGGLGDGATQEFSYGVKSERGDFLPFLWSKKPERGCTICAWPSFVGLADSRALQLELLCTELISILYQSILCSEELH